MNYLFHFFHAQIVAYCNIDVVVILCTRNIELASIFTTCELIFCMFTDPLLCVPIMQALILFQGDFGPPGPVGPMGEEGEKVGRLIINQPNNQSINSFYCIQSINQSINSFYCG